MMRKHTYRAAWMTLGVLSLCLSQWPEGTGKAWAAEGHEKSGTPGGSYGLEVTIPDGVIGVSLHVGAERVGDTAVLYIAQVLPDGPAEKAGLKSGDEITTVDGAVVTGKTYEQVALMVRGEPGTIVRLGIKAETAVREVAVTRVAGQTLYKGQMGSHGGSAK
ncbi:MAG: PDZ domain-containing protein [Nitrospira sp.]|nr:PDZ domain-containing protein [Nitrospira sp.]MBX3368834.1 PDZ domain-containing protein [Nitrospira sp.]